MEGINIKTLRNFKIPLLKFESFIDINTQEQKRRIYFGGKISLKNKQEFENITYYLAICEETKTSKILRKFHFDYDEGNHPKSRSDKPIFHLQYGGKISTRMKNDGFDENHCNHMDTNIEFPRIIFIPMCLIFLIYIIFKEFDQETAELLFSQDSSWHKQLKASEKLLLQPFYKICSNITPETILQKYYNK